MKPSHTNAIFDSKVLSRSHAEIWVDDQKVYIKDTKSSNGTYLNDERLSTCGKYSEPFELKTGNDFIRDKNDSSILHLANNGTNLRRGYPETGR